MASTESIRDKITAEAQRHILTVSDNPAFLINGKRYGADKLREILTLGCERSPIWSKENVKAIETPDMWLATNGRGGTKDWRKAIHWCGIFTAYVLLKSGLTVKWRANHGLISVSGTTYFKKKVRWGKGFDAKTIKEGDVCGIEHANHHFVVVEARAGADELRCVAGNGNYQQIEWQTYSRKAIVTHYSLL